MADAPTFEGMGLGAALQSRRLQVPQNQREYSWTDKEVTELIEDLSAVVDNNNPTYFLGTIVLTGRDATEVSDGQQRLATVTILLAAMRDFYFNHEKKRVPTIEQKFLFQLDVASAEPMPNLTLNKDDNEFFLRYVLRDPDSPERKFEAKLKSHLRIKRAATLCREHVDTIVAGRKPTDQTARIVRWIQFIESGLIVILAKVPESLDAFAMFETLNDRGLGASQVDLVKNHIFKMAASRIGEAQTFWTRMRGSLEAIGDDSDADALTIDFIRWVVTFTSGHTKKQDLMKRVRPIVDSEVRAVSFASDLAEAAPAFAATFHPTHSFWSDYPNDCKRSIKTIAELKVSQIKPLVFAVARYFPPKEAARGLRLCVSIAVRFLISGVRGGTPDKNYAELAHKIGKGEIKTAKAMAENLDFVPSDAVFQQAFEGATVSKQFLARYYLRALEGFVTEEPEPELIPNEDPDFLNLEHVIPFNPQGQWPELSEEDAEALTNRIGNMVLLPARKNVRLGNKGWKEKKKVLSASGLQLTRMLARQAKWGRAEIDARQKTLAAHAVKVWPLTPA